MKIIKELQASDGYPLRYYVWDATGSQQAVFFVHGFMSHSLWAKMQLESLNKRGYKVIGIERRGAGINRQDLGDAPSAQQLLEDTELIVERESKGKKVHLWGWCLGGVIALNYILYSKRTLSSLVLSAPSIFPTQELYERAIRVGAHPVGSYTVTELPLAIREDDFTKGPALENFIMKDDLRINRISARFYELQKKMAQAAWITVMRKKIHIPTLLILAEQDTVVDNKKTEGIFGPIPHCQTIYFDCSHGIQFEKGEELVNNIAGWLSSFKEVDT